MSKYKYYFSLFLCSLLIFSFSTFSISDSEFFTWSSQSTTVPNVVSTSSTPLSSDSNTSTDNPLVLTSSSACLIEQSSRKSFI